jgi:hypothetical protein
VNIGKSVYRFIAVKNPGFPPGKITGLEEKSADFFIFAADEE